LKKAKEAFEIAKKIKELVSKGVMLK